ncbi:MAG: flagellar protein FliO/FliZ [Actinomycetota bacterium]|jgi:flagellar biogenesis protein FliO|nr:flagellar protein FliO/FliZ [Actinomycetota bacterium]
MDPFVRLILATLLICGAWFGVRHHSRRRRGDARRQLEVLARLGLAKGVSVAVVRIADRGLVLGVSDKGVSLVAELSGESLDEVVAGQLRGRPDTSGPELEPEPAEQPRHLFDARSTTHADMGPRTGLVQRLQKMTLRSDVPATTGRPALRSVRGPVRVKKSA